VITGEREAASPGAGPVTVGVAWKIRPGHERASEDWLAGVGRAAAVFEGHQGLTVVRPADGSASEYVDIFRSDGFAHLRAWEESDERQHRLRRPRR
jgi:uncharacterized protein